MLRIVAFAFFLTRPAKVLSPILIVAVLTFAANAKTPDIPPDHLEFFESQIRPVLAEKCYSCHNSVNSAEADLALDHRDGIRSETEHGTVVIPGDPANSLLMKVIRHQLDDLEMPEDAGKLDAPTIASFEAWIRMGAPDPRDSPPNEQQLRQATSWETTLANRKQWWSFRPIQKTEPPRIPGVDRPIDRFVRDKLREHGLTAAPRAKPATLLRRLSYVLNGLPPTAEELRDFAADERPDAYERWVDRMLASERFGERWARHWMDIVRYADSHGSEGDPAIPEIYQYRDYLIRALNSDVAYDQLVREHIAGDLLDQPRINEQLGINESMIGPAHWRLVFHGFAPTDALDEKVRFTDDQINVFSKAFLGLTVSCARCHDHKFDAISQADYYALFGVLASCRPALRDVNLPSMKAKHETRLLELKASIRQTMANHWLAQVSENRSQLARTFREKIDGATHPSHVFYLIAEFRKLQNEGKAADDAWGDLQSRWQTYREQVERDSEVPNERRWDLSDEQHYRAWFADGNGLPTKPHNAGEFRLESPDRIISSILPAGVHANLVSTKHRAFLGSPRFQLDGKFKVWMQITGGGRSMSRYAVEHYPRDGTVYPIRDIKNEEWFWQAFDVQYWQGDFVHLEINTARDAPLRTRSDERSWFGIRDVVVREVGQPSPVKREQDFAAPLFDVGVVPRDESDLIEVYFTAIRDAVIAWRQGRVSDSQALLLDACVRSGLLQNSCDVVPKAERFVQEYLQLESEIPLPTRVPGLQEANAFDQPLFARGNHRQPTRPVPRRFLEAIDATPFSTAGSGRLELARAVLDPANPLTARVMVNRVWHYVFGSGIVPSTDNFGQLGELPSHPELLDYLAFEFQQDWSLKKLIRRLVTTETFRQSSQPTSEAISVDPRNRWLSHASLRRMDAEAIRDTLMYVSRQLDDTMYGPGFPANRDVPRRAVYVQSRRNSLDQFLQAFNSPVPFSTTGRRLETNVPAQSLTLLNSPFVLRISQAWANRTAASANEPKDRVNLLFESAVGRAPTDAERSRLLSYVNEAIARARQIEQQNRELREEIDDLENKVSGVLKPLRERLLAQPDRSLDGPVPLAAWDFRTSLEDTLGQLHGESRGDAKLENGALRLSGGYVATPPIPVTIREKTLLATVQLDNLQQRGGGVITLQTLDGNVFDSIVFGERQPKRWLAGSNGFTRTDDLGGEEESKAKNEPVQIAIAYDADGTIRAYRNGQAYGRMTRRSELQPFAANKAQILFGLRHGTGGSGRLLKGRLLEARIYDQALTAAEIQSIAAGGRYLSEQQLLAKLSSSERQQVLDWRARASELNEQLQEPLSEQDCWARLAHAVMNLKEFIYIR